MSTTSLRIRRATGALLAAVVVGACEQTAPATRPDTPPTFPDGTWRMVSVGAHPLPAVVASYATDDHLQTILDSASLTMTPVGRYQQRLWMRTLRVRDGVLIGHHVVNDVGRVLLASDSGATLLSAYHTWRTPSQVRRLGRQAAEIAEQVVHEPDTRVVGRYERR